MRYDIQDIKVSKKMKIVFSFLAILGLAYSIYVFTHVAEVSGVVTEQQVVVNKETNEAKVIFKVNNKDFVYKDKVTDLIENESFTEYKLASVNFNIGDTIKVHYKDAYNDQKPTYTSGEMQFKITAKSEVPFDLIEEQAMDLVEEYIFLSLEKDINNLEKLIHPDTDKDISYSGTPENLDSNDIELNLINPKFKLMEDTYELSVRENLSTTEEIIQKNRSVFTFKFDGEELKILSVETEQV
ncbi:hypothetical protein [Pseudoneobacillus sp. C159]